MKFLKYFLLLYLLTAGITKSEAFEMKAGTAKGVITPDKPLFMTAWKTPAGKVHDLYARVLVLNDGDKRLVIVTYDLSAFGTATNILRKKCEEELNIDKSRLIFIATHNHQGPLPRLPENFAYMRWAAEKVFTLIKEAIANEMGPIQLYYGNGYGYFVREREARDNSSNAPIDYEVQLLKVMSNNKTLAMLFNHPAHPLRDAVEKYGVSHPGYAIDYIEEKIPGTMAMYGDGCGGNQQVISPEGIDGDLAAAKFLGRELAEVVLDISKEPMQEVTGPISSKFESISLPLAPPVSYTEALQLAKDIPLDIEIAYLKDRGSNWIRALLKHYKEGIPFPTKTADLIYDDTQTYLFNDLDNRETFSNRIEQVIVTKIGKMIFAAMQGEVCAPIGMRIKDKFRYKNPIMVFAYMGEHEVYIPTRELVRMNGYQARSITRQFGSPCGWSPEVEDETVNGVVKMIESVLGEKE
ncbi:hypothetical protein ACFL40_00360 [candidate division KSB1 bacterium]